MLNGQRVNNFQQIFICGWTILLTENRWDTEHCFPYFAHHKQCILILPITSHCTSWAFKVSKALVLHMHAHIKTNKCKSNMTELFKAQCSACTLLCSLQLTPEAKVVSSLFTTKQHTNRHTHTWDQAVWCQDVECYQADRCQLLLTHSALQCYLSLRHTPANG